MPFNAQFAEFVDLVEPEALNVGLGNLKVNNGVVIQTETGYADGVVDGSLNEGNVPIQLYGGYIERERLDDKNRYLLTDKDNYIYMVLT